MRPALCSRPQWLPSHQEFNQKPFPCSWPSPFLPPTSFANFLLLTHYFPAPPTSFLPLQHIPKKRSYLLPGIPDIRVTQVSTSFKFLLKCHLSKMFSDQTNLNGNPHISSVFLYCSYFSATFVTS